MTFTIHGLVVSRGIAIGRAVLVSSNRMDVAHYFIDASQTESEINRIRQARNAVMDELHSLQQNVAQMSSQETSQELNALLEVHLMLLQDETLISGVKSWVHDRLYNAEWAVMSQLEVISRQFDEMEDAYLRERKADLEQVVERVLKHMKSANTSAISPSTIAVSHQKNSDQKALNQKNQNATSKSKQADQKSDQQDQQEIPLILVANDLSPADMLQFKKSKFVGFVTDIGGKTSHTAIVARSMDIPAVVGTRNASQLIRHDDWLIVDGDAGVIIVDPSPVVLAEYNYRQQQIKLDRQRLSCLRQMPAVTLDGIKIELLANIEMPEDAPMAIQSGAVGVGLFRSEFLFMGRSGALPDEEEQYQAYRKAVEGMNGLPTTIRTIDIGADKPLDNNTPHNKHHLYPNEHHHHNHHHHNAHQTTHLNPALGLRAIRWCLADPEMFKTQLRAILRAAAHGKVRLLIPMLAHAREIHQTLALIDQAKTELDRRASIYGCVELGAMIEIPAAALSLPLFLRYFDFLSIGTNDLIQYTLAIDRVDESVAHLYDPLHPAVLQLIAQTIETAQARGKNVCVCGEMAGDPHMTRLLLGLGLRTFSMHPSQILFVKQEILQSDTQKLTSWAKAILEAENPALLIQNGLL